MGIGELRQIVGQLAVSAEALGAVGAALQLRASGHDAPSELQQPLQAAIAAIGGPDLLADVTAAAGSSLLGLSRATPIRTQGAGALSVFVQRTLSRVGKQ